MPLNARWSSTCAVLVAGVVALALTFFATSPRSRLNVMQTTSVLFFALALIRVRTRGKDAYREFTEPPGTTSLLPALSIAVAAGIWATALDFYFINDDFGLLSVTRYLNMDLLSWFFGIGGGKIFYRPVTYATFAIDQFFWGQNPRGFHLTNLIFHGASVAGLFIVTRRLTGNRSVAFMTAGVFAAIPIQVESVAWMAGRFDVLSTSLSIWTVVAYLWYRARGGAVRYALALALSAMAIFSKETAFMLPLLLAAIEVIVFRSLPIPRIAGFVAASVLLFVWRWIALEGFGGYRAGEASSMIKLDWKSLEALFVRGPSQLLLGFNWTQPSWLLPIIAALTVALLVFLILGVPLTDERRRIILLGCAWMIVAMIPGHFILLISPGLSNSRILCLSSVGLALVLGQLVSAPPHRRTQNLAYSALVLLFGLGVLHNLQAWRWTSSLGSATLRQVFQLEPNPAENTQFVFSKLPGDIRGVFFFQAGLSEGLQLVYDRDDIRGYRDTAPSAVAPQIRLEWNGDENSEILIRRE